MNSPLKVLVKRGTAIESQHLVHAMVMDKAGKLRLAFGDQQLLTFPRSSIKAVQALAVCELAYPSQIGGEHLALACSSHRGSPIHTGLALSWLKQLGLGEDDLECGPHAPGDLASYEELIRSGKGFGRLHNNCSGKHSGLLQVAVTLGESPRGYSGYGHPVQKMLRRIQSDFTGLDFEELQWGIDGCGIPSYATPLESIAKMMAALLNSELAKPILQSWATYPDLVSGPGTYTTDIITKTEGSCLVKSGAEGIYTCLLPVQELSVVVKAFDGGNRAAEAALSWLLMELGALNPSQRDALSGYCSPVLKNWSGDVVGAIQVQPI